MAVVEHPVKSTPAQSAVKAAALAAVAQSVNQSGAKITPAPTTGKSKKVEDAAKVEEAPKPPAVDIEEVRFWMRQTVTYVALFACVVAMGSAHWAGKSFLSTAMCGATAAILAGIAGTVVAQISMTQVVQPDESGSTGNTSVQ